MEKERQQELSDVLSKTDETFRAEVLRALDRIEDHQKSIHIEMTRLVNGLTRFNEYVQEIYATIMGRRR